MGWENVFHCEWNEFGQKILKYYWPNAKSYSDITKTDFSIHRGAIDIITGGFPCQPYSQAGKRKGKADDRHLWPEMLRAIREVQPRWVVGENVPGLLNWEGGLVLDEIKADLEAAGFEVLPPLVLPACSVNANHRRDRVWIVAHANGNGFDGSNGQDEVNAGEGREYAQRNIKQSLSNGVTSYPQRIRQQGQGRTQRQMRSKTNRDWKASWSYADGRWPTQSPVCPGNDGLSGNLDGITLSKWRNESIKAAGNAIVPQVAYQIFKAIESYELQQTNPYL